MIVTRAIAAEDRSPQIAISTCWPILPNGPLPADLFPAEQLRHVLFDLLPIKFRCSAVAIRRGLKNHLKRIAPDTWRATVSVEQAARDSAMASAFGNDPRARAWASKIGFQIEESFSRYGMSGIKNRTVLPGEPFAKLLWIGYCCDETLKPFVDWHFKFGVKRPDLGDGIFLTASSLRDAIAAEGCPIQPDSEEFARSMLLFAAILYPDSLRTRIRLLRISSAATLVIA
jgi:hypothetical protein